MPYPDHLLIITYLRLSYNTNFSIWIKLKRGMLYHVTKYTECHDMYTMLTVQNNVAMSKLFVSQ